ncbi:MAG: ribosomal protein L13e [Candidatus Bathyarchaeia archaeon]
MSIKAVVYRGRRKRFGKGFSVGELKAAGLSVREALALKIPVDVRRRTSHEENIRVLREYIAIVSRKEGLKEPAPSIGNGGSD